MVKTKFYLDDRRNKKNAPVKICLYKRGLRAYINTGIFLDEEFWDKDKLEVVGCARAADLNRILARKKFEIDNALSVMDTTGMSITRIKRELEKEEDNTNPLLYPIFVKYIDRCKARRTRELYQATWNWIERYEKNSHNIEIDEVDYNWLSGLDKFMSNISPSKNARNIHFRNLRAVFNYAIDEEYTTNYPFRKFKIKPEETEKRSLSVNELRSLICYNPTDDGEAFAKDFFLLMFYLIGINTVDILLNASIYKGRLEYKRAKTGKLYSIKLEPEAMEIIFRLQDGENIIGKMTKAQSYKTVAIYADKYIKVIAKKIGIPKISSYWARHTWATIASSIDIPKDTISAALGHGGNTVTDVYIRFDRRKVDEANRKVINYVLCK